MKRNTQKRWIGMLSLTLIAVAAIVVVLTVFAGTNDDLFTATAYSDVIRFEAQGVASLHVRVYDLSGKKVWDSGVMSGDCADWDRRNEFGERLAYGAYLYSAQGWSTLGDSIFQKNGKLALMPGDKVQLQLAPLETTPQSDDNLAPFGDKSFTFQPMAVNVDHSGESWAFGQVGIGTVSPDAKLQVAGSDGAWGPSFKGNLNVMGAADNSLSVGSYGAPPWGVWLQVGDNRGGRSETYPMLLQPIGGNVGIGTINPTSKLTVAGMIESTSGGFKFPDGTTQVTAATGNGAGYWAASGNDIYNTNSGNIGIGTVSPDAKLQVAGSDGAWGPSFKGNLNVMGAADNGLSVGSYGAPPWGVWLQVGDNRGGGSETYPMLLQPIGGNVGIGTTSPTAKLEIEGSTGQDLIAAYNSSDRVFVVKSTGEVRADGIVYADDFQSGGADVAERINTSEWVEAGDVVEIDPEHVGFFRKVTSLYSRRVAGIISTSPGLILGNNIAPQTDSWDDNRPVLAVAGRVPCKVSTENGPIQIGDLLVSSSSSGIAMKGDSEKAMGAVVGKAMEPLRNGEGSIMVQVMLR